MVTRAAARNGGATVFAYRVHNLEKYGVDEFDANERALSIEEKPKALKNNCAVAEIFLNDRVFDISAPIKPAVRGRFEMIALNA